MSNTAKLVAHATSDENGNVYGGDPGCQTGSELQARQWYQRGWDCVYRAVNAEDREKIALFMEKAVANGFIGYNTNRYRRDTLFETLLTNGYKVDEVNTSVECDCSALAYCAVFSVTGVECYIDPAVKEEYKIIKCPKVNNYDDYIENQCAGMFEKLEGTDYTDSGDNLLRGDILVAWDAHIAVWI